jgi:DNA-binding transcriptional ArsR family regulator
MTTSSSSFHAPRAAARAQRRVNSRAARGAITDLQRILCQESRARILQALGVGPLSVADLAGVIGRRPAATSQHLRVLRDNDVVHRERQGNSSLYRLSDTLESRRAADALAAFERA